VLKKNIYITYPAGYMGTYVNWLISVSERDRRSTTTLDPLTEATNAHGHIKYPTHLSWSKALTWLAKNRPTQPLIYPLNTRCASDYHLTTEYAVQNIMRIDPDPVFINCHDGCNMDTKKFGALNMFRKWPTFVSAIGVWHNDYNPVMDSDIVRARNWLLDNWMILNPGNNPVNHDVVQYNLQGHRDWFCIRKQTAPMEITEDQYLIPDQMPHVIDIDLRDILKPNFVTWLQKQLDNIDLGEFDWAHAQRYHATYIEAQENCQWFDAIKDFRQNCVLDQWLFKDAMSQALMLAEFPRALVDSVLSRPIHEILEVLGWPSMHLVPG
jgi:hypothetical protein